MSRFPEYALQEDYFFKADLVNYCRFRNSAHWEDDDKLALYNRSTLHETMARYPDEYQATATEMSGRDSSAPTLE